MHRHYCERSENGTTWRISHQEPWARSQDGCVVVSNRHDIRVLSVNVTASKLYTYIHENSLFENHIGFGEYYKVLVVSFRRVGIICLRYHYPECGTQTCLDEKEVYFNCCDKWVPFSQLSRGTPSLPGLSLITLFSSFAQPQLGHWVIRSLIDRG